MYRALVLWVVAGTAWAQSEPVCGNGTVESGEQCDDGSDNSDTAGNHCRGNCMLPRCGDGTVDAAEECDDGNTEDYDACSADCSGSSLAKDYVKPEPPPAKVFDPDVALRRAVLTTFYAPLGQLYGPSMGHFYAGEIGRGIGMTLARTAMVGTIVGTDVLIASGDLQFRPGVALIVIESLIFSGFVSADIIDAPAAARRATEKSKEQ